MKVLTTSEAQTQALAAKIAKKLQGGETLALLGDLGAGKTAFTKGLAKALGIRAVSSPTFVLMKVYKIKKHRCLKQLVHVDAYRIASGESLRAIGLLDYIGQPDTIVLIEWADRVSDILPKNVLRLRFAHEKEDNRTITLPKRLADTLTTEAR